VQPFPPASNFYGTVPHTRAPHQHHTSAPFSLTHTPHASVSSFPSAPLPSPPHHSKTQTLKTKPTKQASNHGSLPL